MALFWSLKVMLYHLRGQSYLDTRGHKGLLDEVQLGLNSGLDLIYLTLDGLN